MPKIFVKADDQDEIEVSQKIEGLLFLSDNHAVSLTNTYQTSTGVDGVKHLISTIDKSKYTINLMLHFSDFNDFKAKKSQIYRFLARKVLYRFRTDSAPLKIAYGYVTSFDVKPTIDGSHVALITIDYENPFGVLFSNFRSDEMNFSAASRYSDQLNLPNSQPAYSSTQTRFNIYNASDMQIDPYQQHHDLVINVKFGGNNLTIKNITNGTSWTYQQPAKKTDSIKVDGVNTYFNNELATANTDFDNIVLETGNNTIDVSGSTDFEINFSFPFIYLN